MVRFSEFSQTKDYVICYRLSGVTDYNPLYNIIQITYTDAEHYSTSAWTIKSHETAAEILSFLKSFIVGAFPIGEDDFTLFVTAIKEADHATHNLNF